MTPTSSQIVKKCFNHIGQNAEKTLILGQSAPKNSNLKPICICKIKFVFGINSFYLKSNINPIYVHYY